MILTSERFNPKKYLNLIHASSTWNELLQGRENLRKSVEEKSILLKNIVKENFDRYVHAKLTIDSNLACYRLSWDNGLSFLDVYADMKQTIYTKNEYGLGKIIKTMEAIKKEGDTLFKPVIENNDKMIELSRKLETLK